MPSLPPVPVAFRVPVSEGYADEGEAVTNPCGVLIYDRKATAERGGPVIFRPCGAPANYIVSINNDHLFATCSRHNDRLDRAGVRAATPTRRGAA